jgi:hypothetical protein
MPKPFISLGLLAPVLGVAPGHLARLYREGQLLAHRLGDRGRLRVSLPEAERLARQVGVTLPAEITATVARAEHPRLGEQA